MDIRTVAPAKAVDQTDRDDRGGTISLSDLVEQVWGFIRRQYLVFLIVTACSIGLGLVYLLTTPARYTAHAMMQIDSSKLRVLQQQQVSFADTPLDTTQVETQVEVLKSEGLGLSVVKEMHLTEDAEFAGASARFWGTGNSMQGADSRQSQALDALLSQRTISRVGRTYVLDIAFTSLRPDRAAEIANGIAEAYIVDQLESKYQATRRASKWLQDRITELREQVSAVDRAVLDYKEKNKIVDIAVASAAGSASTSTRSLEEQQLTEISSQLSTARAASTEAKARLDRIQDVLKMGIPDASVVDSLRSEIVIRLRNQYLDLAAREGLLSQRYGSDHQAAINVRAQMEQIRQSVTDELRRIAESTRSDYEIATAREQSLKNKLADMVSDARITNRERIGLRELESNAQAIHTIYDNFLQRYMEAIQQQSFPITESRVISPATAPKQKSSPRTSIVLGLATVLGLALSLAIAGLREALDPVFRSTRQVQETLQVRCLAVVPLLDAPPRSRLVMPWRRNAGRDVASSAEAHAMFGRAVLDPSSVFASAFRSIKVAVDVSTAGQRSRVIGVISTLPDEGKSTIASNFAELVAHVGKNVILIDGDLRNPTISRAMAPDATNGLLEVLAGKVELQDAVRTARGLAFLPTIIESRDTHSSELLGSEALKVMIERLRETYDYIIIDLPPLGPVAEVRGTASMVDSYVQVIEWGRSRKNTVRQQLLGAPEVYERLLGVVLNKVDLKEFGRHETLDAVYGQNGYY
ncbi:polysaccharide biosynthesis tyrosine autokinase [Bradyrhizobium neotropicale]|uniref:polysaccharide biosynthesis tyrosine autokinase n=1 Tax=Bradyrhizobium neotropicale TaxID=1497615 RepID=UPI0007C4EDEE|nr:polysaccharide biosynthesis tyrosine autokinase [Bradyrhizobium neotropicale]